MLKLNHYLTHRYVRVAVESQNDTRRVHGTFVELALPGYYYALRICMLDTRLDIIILFQYLYITY
jgi:hypothetical protein